MSSLQPDTRSLSPYAQQVAECYAVIYPQAPARSKVMKWLNRARKTTTGEKGLISTDMSEAINELVKAGILEPSIEGRKGVAARGPLARLGILTRFCESAHQRGVYPIILEELASATHYHYQRHHPIPADLAGQFARHALISSTFDGFPIEAVSMSSWLWLTEARAKPYLQQLPPDYRNGACVFCLNYLVHTLQPFKIFVRTADAVNPDGQHRLIVAKGLIFLGELSKAQSLIDALQQQRPEDKLTQVECQSMRALLAMLTGDDTLAMQHIQTTLEIERSGTRKRIIYPDVFCFSLALFALVRLATTESRSLFESLMQARKKLKIESDLNWPLQVAAQAERPHTDFRPALPTGEPEIATAIYAIASRWHKDVHHPADHKGVSILLTDLWQQAKAAGYDWVAAETQTVMEANATSEEQRQTLINEQFDSETAENCHQSLGTSTLTQLVTALEPWEYSLQALEQLALKAKPEKASVNQDASSNSRRLIWLLKELRGSAVEASPMEQTLGKNGNWSGGRKVALKRLRENAPSMSHLIPQDIKASATIQKLSYGWDGRTTYETDARTIYHLAGHPRVYDEHGEQLDVVEQPPVLTVTNIDQHLRIRVEPSFNGPHYRTQIDQENQRVEVSHFTAAHRRIAEAIPPSGLLIPTTAKDRLQDVLDALVGDMSVQSDQQIAGRDMQDGCAEPVLAMEPAGQSLRVRLRVEPLPNSGVYFDVATGGSVVYVQGPDGSVPVKRDMQHEREKLDELLLRSDVLAEHYDGRAFFVLENPVEALELLEDAQAGNIRCLWPNDIPFRIKARADLNHVSLKIKQAKDWFSASGSLKLSDKNSDPLSLARLLQLMQAQPGSRFIELGKGEFLSLSRTLKQQLDTLQAFSRPEKKDNADSHIHPMALLALEPLLDKAIVNADKVWKQHRIRVQKALETTAAVPSSLQAELRSYQRDGYHWLERLGKIGAGACLADDMGLGKTVQTLALLLSRAEGGPALVVAPTSVVGNWVQESQRFAPTLNVIAYGDTSQDRTGLLSSMTAFDLLVISYGLLVRDIKDLQQVHWHSVVLDEAQAIKNSATQRAKCVKQLKADFRVVTTGTPVQNNLMDLHSLFGFLNPQLLGSAANFRQRYALPITRDDSDQARNQLQQLISPFLLRRHKRDVLQELPERTELTLKVQLSSEEAALYEMIRQEALESLKKTDDHASSAGNRGTGSSGKSRNNTEPDAQANAKQKMIILSYLTKLRRLCCHPSLIAPDWSGPESKLQEFSATLSELISSGHRSLVFSQFVDHLTIIKEHLNNQKISYQYLDGSTTAKQRTERVRAFQAGEGQVFLISLNAGGAGLNLTAADYVIHMDPWWNPAVEDQASDRAHRIGQQRPVTVVRMVATGTIEEQIQELHATKRELADSVLAGADSPSLNMEAMMRLLRG